MDKLVISWTDFFRALKRGWWLLLIAGLAGGLFLFLHQLRKPICYMAEAEFECPKNSANTGGLAKALMFFGGNDSYTPDYDPLIFLSSQPVMEEVVKNLDLQAHITIHEKRFARIRSMWHTWRAEKVRKAVGGGQPASSILRGALVVDQLHFSDPIKPMRVLAVDYPARFCATLTIFPLDEERFAVQTDKQVVSEGTFGTPFSWEKGTFTLLKTGEFNQKSYPLTFVPLREAAHSLSDAISVKKTPDNPTLLQLTFYHPDRHLAAAILNETMESYQRFLKKKGEGKIEQQLAYLARRQAEASVGLDRALEEHQHYLEGHLAAGRTPNLDHEISSLVSEYAKRRKERDEAVKKIKSLERELKDIAPEPTSVETLSISSAKKLISENERQLSELALEKQQNTHYLDKLDEPDFDPANLSHAFKDSTLFGTIRELNKKLNDGDNWTQREQEQLRQEILTEKSYLKEHLVQAQEGISVQETVCQAQILSLKDALLTLLKKQEKTLEKELGELTEKMTFFPENWLRSQKIGVNTQLYQDMMETVTKMIEGKNIQYHLDILATSPFSLAATPLLPKSPKLVLGFKIGACAGIFGMIVLLLLWEIWLGPSASYTHLRQMGRRVLYDNDKSLWELTRLGSKSMLIASQRMTTLPTRLNDYMMRHNNLSISIENLTAHPASLALAERTETADSLVYVISNERYRELDELPAETLFVVPMKKQRTFKLSEVESLLKQKINALSSLASSLNE